MSNDRSVGDDASSGEPIAGIELSPAESWALLRESGVGRLAVVVDDRPEIFPVNHLVDHGSVVLRTALGTKFMGAVGHWVAFEADGYDPETGSAWSVVLKGEGQEVNRLYDVLEVIELPLFPWHSAPKSHFIRIEPHSITGRRFQVNGGARSAGAAETVLPADREPTVKRPTS
ncbi:MAG: pyridoxamine 5'-phosphate oxidase family protein [Actinomycetota bacterium]